MRTYVIISCANSLTSWQSPSLSMNSPSFVNCIYRYLCNSSSPLDIQPCESNPRITARVCDVFPPLCHSLFPSGLCFTELGQWTVWINSDLNPRFPKTRPAATFVNCVCGINYTVISAVRYTTYCYLSTPANQPRITSSAPRHKKLGCLCFKTSDLQSQLHLKKTHSYKNPCEQIGCRYWQDPTPYPCESPRTNRH